MPLGGGVGVEGALRAGQLQAGRLRAAAWLRAVATAEKPVAAQCGFLSEGGERLERGIGAL